MISSFILFYWDESAYIYSYRKFYCIYASDMYVILIIMLFYLFTVTESPSYYEEINPPGAINYVDNLQSR